MFAIHLLHTLQGNILQLGWLILQSESHIYTESFIFITTRLVTTILMRFNS